MTEERDLEDPSVGVASEEECEDLPLNLDCMESLDQPLPQFQGLPLPCLVGCKRNVLLL